MDAHGIFTDTISVLIKILAPVLLLCTVVGTLVAILQAVTQIHEQSISFVAKMIVVVVLMMAGGSWALNLLKEYTIKLFTLIG